MKISLNLSAPYNIANRHYHQKSNFCINRYDSVSANFLLPNYNQIDKSIIVFCAKKNNNPLNDYFAGYQKEKTKLNDILISQLNNKKELPSSMLLAFPDDYIEYQVMRGITSTSNANFVIIPPEQENLCDIIKSELATAKDKYRKTRKQTVIIIEEAQKVIGMTPAYAVEFSFIPMSKNEVASIKSNNVDLKTVNFFKSLLDNLGQADFDLKEDRHCATILFTTKNPHHIHPDLISRDGKMKTIIFPTLCGRNIKNAITFESEKVKDVLADLPQNPQNLSSRQKKQLDSLVASKKFDNLSIDIQNIPFQKIMTHATPNKKDGAFSNRKIKEIAQKSLKDYISQPKTPYSVHFVFNIASAQRDIPAERYLNYESMRVLFS